QEPFEAMLGVPSTERFYVNLGGTEGFIDVTYKYVERTQEFAVDWTTPWLIPPPPPPPESPPAPPQMGVLPFNEKVTVTLKALHRVIASVRVFGNGQVSNHDLGISVEVSNSANVNSSFSLSPNRNGLTVGPGSGTANYNLGATSSWTTSISAGPTPQVV